MLRYRLVVRRVATMVARHHRLATALAAAALFGTLTVRTATSGIAGSPDQQLTPVSHFNSLTRYDHAPQYWSEADNSPSGSYSATAGPYYFSIYYGQEVDWSDWWQQGDCPCFGYIEWNRTYGWADVKDAKRGGECGCAPFEMNTPTVGTDEWEWYHHRRNKSEDVSKNGDTQQWVGTPICCPGSDDAVREGTYREQDDYYDPLVKAFMADGGSDSYPMVTIYTPDYYADWGY